MKFSMLLSFVVVCGRFIVALANVILQLSTLLKRIIWTIGSDTKFNSDVILNTVRKFLFIETRENYNISIISIVLKMMANDFMPLSISLFERKIVIPHNYIQFLMIHKIKFLYISVAFRSRFYKN